MNTRRSDQSDELGGSAGDDEPGGCASSDASGGLGGYAESMAEIESILTELADDDVDIDTLAAKVERASRLISHCEGRLRETELTLQTVLARHAAPDSDSAAD